MRLRLRVRVGIATLLVGSTAAAGEPPTPGPDGVTVQDALDEPADPDDAADIRADADPDDVGQRGLDPAKRESPNAGRTPPGDSAPKDADPAGE